MGEIIDWEGEEDYLAPIEFSVGDTVILFSVPDKRDSITCFVGSIGTSYPKRYYYALEQKYRNNYILSGNNGGCKHVINTNLLLIEKKIKIIASNSGNGEVYYDKLY